MPWTYHFGAGSNRVMETPKVRKSMLVRPMPQSSIPSSPLFYHLPPLWTSRDKDASVRSYHWSRTRRVLQDIWTTLCACKRQRGDWAQPSVRSTPTGHSPGVHEGTAASPDFFIYLWYRLQTSGPVVMGHSRIERHQAMAYASKLGRELLCTVPLPYLPISACTHDLRHGAVRDKMASSRFPSVLRSGMVLGGLIAVLGGGGNKTSLCGV